MKDRRVSGKCGFTMVELVVIIGLVLVLASFAVSMLLKARTVSKDIVCMNNLKQISEALQMYRSDIGELPSDIYPSLMAYVGNSAQVFKCPADKSNSPNSYGAFYIARNLADTNKLILGCPRHKDKSIALFGWPQFNVGHAGKVLWNGKEVEQGTVVQGGTLLFEDGTQVAVSEGLNVGVMLSTTDPNKNLYSTICIQDGDAGSVTVNHTGTSQFEVVTPSLITGVAGTAFTVTTYWPDPNDPSSCKTRVECTAGKIYTENRTTDEITTISSGQDATGTSSITPEPEAGDPGKTVKPPTYKWKWWWWYYHHKR